MIYFLCFFFVFFFWIAYIERDEEAAKDKEAVAGSQAGGYTGVMETTHLNRRQKAPNYMHTPSVLGGYKEGKRKKKGNGSKA